MNTADQITLGDPRPCGTEQLPTFLEAPLGATPDGATLTYVPAAEFWDHVNEGYPGRSYNARDPGGNDWDFGTYDPWA